MEMRRLGLAKKPMITVPANIVGQFGRDFRLLYPAANIFVADEETFSAKNRQKAMAQVATGNWDAVVISHDAFGLLPVADETFNAFLQKEIDTLEDAIRESKKGKADAKIQKELEKAKKRLEAKLREKADREGKDDSLTFEQLGVDALFVDEADMFKNLYFTTRATRIAGIPNSESNRAFDMLIKSRHVTDKTGGRLIFATGTPIANTVAEMYTMLRYLSHKELDARGLGQFDAWAQQFGESVTGLETSPDGAGFRVNTRFAKFSNLPELQSLFRQVADVQTADMLKLPVPKLFNGKYETISVPASQTLLD
jgi:N12 class adenine-specific DNA methylase